MDMIFDRLSSYFVSLSLHGLNIRWEDIVEVIIISFLVYEIMAWVRHTKVWLLMKGIIIILVFILYISHNTYLSVSWHHIFHKGFLPENLR